MKVERVRISGVMTVAKDLSLVLLGGLNLLEDSDSMPSVDECFGVTRKLGIACVLRASFDRASCLSVSSFRGHGVEEGCASPNSGSGNSVSR